MSPPAMSCWRLSLRSNAHPKPSKDFPPLFFTGMGSKLNPIKFYGIIHFPTKLAHPVLLHLERSAPWCDELFQSYMKESEKLTKQHGGGYRNLVSNSELGRWGAPIPPEANAQLFELEIPRNKMF